MYKKITLILTCVLCLALVGVSCKKKEQTEKKLTMTEAEKTSALKDFIQKAEQSVRLCPGRFLVLFPGDAHRPGMAAEKPEGISRIVFKIEI